LVELHQSIAAAADYPQGVEDEGGLWLREFL
jgi:hypothetical protein